MGRSGREIKVGQEAPPIVGLKLIKESCRDSCRYARKTRWVDGVRGEQDRKEYGRVSARVRSNCEADLPDFPRIEHFGCFSDGLFELRLIYETGGNVHNSLSRVEDVLATFRD
jgi:hypothetical protein